MSNEPPNRLPPEERYRRDRMFATLVDVLHSCLHNVEKNGTEWTPTELREALLLAAMRHDIMCTIPRIVVTREDAEMFARSREQLDKDPR